ncbi:threonine synthase [uncultured Ruthenibacterium sp.]|uniref:threonine synthase n=1 Tax=uncultured Ruthenibacterium sp. TaxID=1905347 RepID=UPI00349E5479
MEYTSTRNSALSVEAAQAILRGIAPDGGLFVPVHFPHLSAKEVYGLDYPQTAVKVLSAFLSDYDCEFLKQAAQQTYGLNFNGKAGYVRSVGSEDMYALELWHGPTCAFKDYALQLMPKLLVRAKQLRQDKGITKILVATSGDTGKAALAGYAGLPGIKIAVFYPNDGTSEIQRLQMVTQEGENVAVYAVQGNFDDAQTGVKRVFGDQSVAHLLEEKGEQLSSANSINWGRLVPQIVYYFFAYAQLVAQGKVLDGATVDFCVPTGNFGDILAGYYAKQMGLPVGKLICASNQNNVLTDFLTSGIYDVRRDFYKTQSPSMDILVSSNLERLLYHVTGDSAQVANWMDQLAQNGWYRVDEKTLATIQQTFACGCASDLDGEREIRSCFENNQYLMDPHTAVAWYVARSLKEKGTLSGPCVVLSTASPYKFANSVLGALGVEVPGDEFEALQKLENVSGTMAPESLRQLKNKPERFQTIISKEEIREVALSF